MRSSRRSCEADPSRTRLTAWLRVEWLLGGKASPGEDARVGFQDVGQVEGRVTAEVGGYKVSLSLLLRLARLGADVLRMELLKKAYDDSVCSGFFQEVLGIDRRV